MEHENLMINVENLIEKELEYARSKFSNLNSSHEGYAVVLEEFDELKEEIASFEQNIQSLWKAVKSNESDVQFENINMMEDIIRNVIKESIQIGAMCRRFREDILHE